MHVQWLPGNRQDQGGPAPEKEDRHALLRRSPQRGAHLPAADGPGEDSTSPAGVLKPGDELPSIRSLSVPLGVNPMTISKAYNLLVHDEILERRPGKPLVVADMGQAEIADRRLEQLREACNPRSALARQLDIDDARGHRAVPETACRTRTGIRGGRVMKILEFDNVSRGYGAGRCPVDSRPSVWTRARSSACWAATAPARPP